MSGCCQRCDRPNAAHASEEEAARLREWDQAFGETPPGSPWHTVRVDDGTKMLLCPGCFIEMCNWLGIYPESPVGAVNLLDADKAKAT